MRKKIVLVFTVIITIFVFAGCSNNNTPTKTVKSHFNNIEKEISKKKSKETLAAFISNENNIISSDLSNALLNAIGKTNVKVNSETISGDNAKVEVSVIGVNLESIIASYVSRCISDSSTIEGLSEEAATKHSQEILIEELNNSTTEERKGVINLTKDSDGNWTITEDDYYIEVLTGISPSDNE